LDDPQHADEDGDGDGHVSGRDHDDDSLGTDAEEGLWALLVMQQSNLESLGLQVVVFTSAIGSSSSMSMMSWMNLLRLEG
jgi:hypothetical protein